jgi:DNA invertase Pin-like site-specific DNA recombinase
VLAVAKFDRLSRSLADFSALIARSQREGWVLTCLDPEIDLSTSTGRAFAGMLAVFAEFERSTYIDRMRGGKRAKAAAGGYIGGARLARRFGSELQTADDGTRHYVPVEAERRMIPSMADDYAAGRSLSSIAARLTAEDVPTTGGASWSRQSVANILKREGVSIRPRGRVPVA